MQSAFASQTCMEDPNSNFVTNFLFYLSIQNTCVTPYLFNFMILCVIVLKMKKFITLLVDTAFNSRSKTAKVQ